MTAGQKVLKFFETRVVRAVFLAISLLVAIGIIRSVVAISQKRGLVAERKAVLEAEKVKHARLESELREATGSAFIERAAREKLGLVREGEQVVIMDTSRVATDSGGGRRTELTPWRAWWQLFF